MRIAAAVLLTQLLASPAGAPQPPRDLVEQMLTLPAPPPGYATVAAVGQAMAKLYAIPADDATLDTLVGYWSNSFDNRPSPRVAERLGDAVVERPEIAWRLLRVLVGREDVCRAVHAYIANATDGKEELAEWERHACASALPGLIAAVRSATDDAESGSVRGSEDIEALAASHWNDAKPVLEDLAASSQPRVRALALALLFEHGDMSRFEELKATATSPSAPAYARDAAFMALTKRDWDGRDQWLIEEMSDSSFSGLRDGMYGFAPYEELLSADPDKWIPIFTKVIEHGDRGPRSVAARAFGGFVAMRRERADVVRPLIRWIGDPSWIADESMARLRIVQNVAPHHLTDAIPGLIWAVEHDEDDGIREYAAEALGEFGDPRANVALRHALAKSPVSGERRRILDALAKTGGITTAEYVRAMEAAILHLRAHPGDAASFFFDPKPLPEDVAIGILALERFSRDDVAAAVLARAAIVRDTDPLLARQLIAAVARWDVPAADAYLVSAIADGTVPAELVAHALARRTTLRVNTHAALARLRATKGVGSGIAAVLIGDATDERRLLASDDVDAVRGLLAAARVVREPLPINAVAGALARLPRTASAADAYLDAEDSPAARAIVAERHRGELRITGSRLGWDPGDDTTGPMNAWEQRTIARFRAIHADEMLLLGAGSAWSAAHTFVAIEIAGDDAWLNLGPNVKRVRFDAAKLADLRAFLNGASFDDLGPLDTGVIDGVQYEYLHITHDGARRVFMNNPAHAPGSPYDELVRRMQKLAEESVPAMR
jgi:HEAT repeat protein